MTGVHYSWSPHSRGFRLPLHYALVAEHDRAGPGGATFTLSQHKPPPPLLSFLLPLSLFPVRS